MNEYILVEFVETREVIIDETLSPWKNLKISRP
jgi:hypothetical protein